MAKLITGLAMLNQMQDPRKTIKTACYLDEAASLDQRNQRNLIEIAEEFGFTLIFASPNRKSLRAIVYPSVRQTARTISAGSIGRFWKPLTMPTLARDHEHFNRFR